MTEPILNELGKKWEKLVLNQFQSLPPEEKKRVSDGLESLVQQLKEEFNLRKELRHKDDHGYGLRSKSVPLSKEAVLIGIMTAMYFEKYGETPTMSGYDILSGNVKGN